MKQISFFKSLPLLWYTGIFGILEGSYNTNFFSDDIKNCVDMFNFFCIESLGPAASYSFLSESNVVETGDLLEGSTLYRLHCFYSKLRKIVHKTYSTYHLHYSKTCFSSLYPSLLAFWHFDKVLWSHHFGPSLSWRKGGNWKLTWTQIKQNKYTFILNKW